MVYGPTCWSSPLPMLFSRYLNECLHGEYSIGGEESQVRQLATPDELRGRMSSIMMIFFMGGPQLGEFEAGLVAAAAGAPLSVVLGGIATLGMLGIMAL